MIEVTKTTYPQMEKLAADAGIPLPIEQTEAWAHFQDTIDGRQPIGAFLISEEDKAIAVMSLIDFDTHGFHFARSPHGPVYFTTPDEETEKRVIDALSDYARHHLRAVKFLRIAIAHEDIEGVVPVLSTVPYDRTVVLDLTGGDDAILSRMKRRGRRDVRKALRECPATCADETDDAMKSFAEYYDVMKETGERDGFNPAPMSDYENMLRVLGPDHARVFAARLGEKVEAWSIVTANDGICVRYYGAMRNGAMRMHVTDKLLYTEACELGRQGFLRYDLMGIGSDFAPSLLGLNEFKTKFTEEVTEVAPERDVPVRKAFYNMLLLAKKVRSRDKDNAEEESDEADSDTSATANSAAKSAKPADTAKKEDTSAKKTKETIDNSVSQDVKKEATPEARPEETPVSSFVSHVLTQEQPSDDDDEPINDPDLMDVEDEDDSYLHEDDDADEME